MLTQRQARLRRTAGLTLIESLVAIALLALGIAALAWTQTRLLVDGRQATARASAIWLIHDLAERMRLNPTAAAAGAYALAWSAQPPAQDCSTACTGTALAQADLGAWRAAVRQLLPLGNAMVFQTADDARQLGIAIAWPAQDTALTARDAAFQAPFAITLARHGVDCPAEHHCQIAYVLP